MSHNLKPQIQGQSRSQIDNDIINEICLSKKLAEEQELDKLEVTFANDINDVIVFVKRWTKTDDQADMVMYRRSTATTYWSIVISKAMWVKYPKLFVLGVGAQRPNWVYEW